MPSLCARPALRWRRVPVLWLRSHTIRFYNSGLDTRYGARYIRAMVSKGQSTMPTTYRGTNRSRKASGRVRLIVAQRRLLAGKAHPWIGGSK